MTITRQWSGQPVFEEAWFVEVLFSADRGLWLRFVLDATRGRAEIWALALERGGVRAAERIEIPLTAPQGPLFEHPLATLQRDRVRGTVGDISFDLSLTDVGPRHRHVPLTLQMLGLGRTYSPAILDLRVRGQAHIGKETWEVETGMGVLGHLWGGQSRVEHWAWAHCNAFDRDGILFEGLSARVGPLELTSLLLNVDGHSFAFSRKRDLFRNSSTRGESSWSFEARRGTLHLTGHVSMRPQSAARVRYERDPRPLYCMNSRFADIRVIVRDAARGINLDLRSRECAFELVGPEPLEPLHVG